MKEEQMRWLATFYEQNTFRAKIPTFLAGP
jgi:hypothetical protein